MYMYETIVCLFFSEDDDEDTIPISPLPFSAMPPVVAVRPRGDGGRGSLPPQPIENPPLPPPRHGSSTMISPIHMGRVPLPHIPQQQQREQPSPPAVQPRHARPQSASGGSAPSRSNSVQFGPGKQEKDVRMLENITQIKSVCIILFMFCCSHK